jgi:hypothetical protein
MAAYAGKNVVGSQGMNVLDQHPNLFVKQTRKGWLQECLGCSANTEFKIATMQNPNNDVMYAIENSGCCVRFFCGIMRPFTLTVSEGGQPGGKVHSFHERPFALPLGSCKCCCFQQVVAKDGNGAVIGSIQEDFYMCVPSFKVLSGSIPGQGVHQYNMHMPTCCGGMCVDMCSQGCCSCRLPFHIYLPGKENNGEQVGEIVKVWSGAKKELTSDADNFELHFPGNVDAATKTRLLSATFLINQLFFERG